MKVDVVSDRPPKSKRSRKKKTIAELKEAECLLLEERRKLKNQVATLQFTLEKQRHENERLKRFKVDSLSRQTAETGDKSEEIDSIKKIKVTMSMSSCCLHKHKKEVLPDLNLPVDENSDSNMLCGIS
ncbi:uncharacterized protein [Euphorbia lathyris]|uniref:uncharacterized protein isoform X2 n=1 Tax=Euphorbia lathyris TaxID=212925 RepID=UPI0033132E2A